MNLQDKQRKNKLSLLLYDVVLFLLIDILLFVAYDGSNLRTIPSVLANTVVMAVVLFVTRFGFNIYSQVWRYGGIQCYILLIVTDALAFVIYFVVERLVFNFIRVSFAQMLAFFCIDLLAVLMMRMLYRYAYKYGDRDDNIGKYLRILLKIFSFNKVKPEKRVTANKTKIAIIGAGTVGVGLADELSNSNNSVYEPVCFVDIDNAKSGRDIHGLEVISGDVSAVERLKAMNIKDVVFTFANMGPDEKFRLYELYKQAGFNVKVYTTPVVNDFINKTSIREPSIEDLLMRTPKTFLDSQTHAYYSNKVILITGGGGSIGSEICRQLAAMQPKQIIILDIYENCAYDLQQELKFKYKNSINFCVEIVSITNKKGLNRVFEKYKPDICINAAAHKHVPLMENNCIEAVENNVFGALNVMQCCEEYGCNRFMMVSTDKAVNPTNVMGATKRVCEMIMQAYSTRNIVRCSATRFGNVLGSAGSVIPLFMRQIKAGGPVTVTDKRIIRFFMTIPEASQLVLVSGTMANNGELFVLNMGNPVKIYELAKKMISLCGNPNVQIVETGLRPGEKLYEELLVKDKSHLTETNNDLIFIEKEVAITMDELDEKLQILREACDTGVDDNVRQALHTVVPTFKKPEEVNSKF